MINKATLLGRIGKKDTKTLTNGTELTSLSIATSKKWMDKSGTRQETTTWHKVDCFNKLAEIAAKYAHVGDVIYIEGEIQNKKYEKDGQTKWLYSVTASELKLLPQGEKKEGTGEAPPPAVNQSLAEDDIPF